MVLVDSGLDSRSSNENSRRRGLYLLEGMAAPVKIDRSHLLKNECKKLKRLADAHAPSMTILTLAKSHEDSHDTSCLTQTWHHHAAWQEVLSLNG